MPPLFFCTFPPQMSVVFGAYMRVKSCSVRSAYCALSMADAPTIYGSSTNVAQAESFKESHMGTYA